jgi:hypothetical protein
MMQHGSGTMLVFLRFVVVILTLSVATAWAQSREPRVALVIGNAAYKHSAPLRNPVNDAEAMAIALAEAGFEVIKTTNADRGRMARALSEFARKQKADGVSLFFYAGHGIQVGGANYLIPVEADIAEEHDASLLGIDVQQVLRVMENAGSRFNMVFLDACRDNPFERQFRSAGARGLAPIDAPRGTLIAYATAPGKTAADGDGSNGLFTAELLKAMSRPGLGVEEVLKQAGAGVEKASNNRQVPWINSSFRGRFSFFDAPNPQTASKAAPPRERASAEAQEQSAWDAVKGSTAPATYEAFLRRFPNGVYGDIARAKVAELSKAPVAAPAATKASPAGPQVRELAGTYVAVRAAKVRALPDPVGQDLGTARPETLIPVTGRVKDTDWLRVEWKGADGYVLASYLQEVNPAELAAWNKVRDSRNAGELEGFLRSWPAGLYAARANSVIASLRAEAAKAAPPPAAPAPPPPLSAATIRSLLTQQDRKMIHDATQYALESTASDQPTTWRNPQTGHSGTIRAGAAAANARGQPCRRFKQSHDLKGQAEERSGTACRERDGTWRLND